MHVKAHTLEDAQIKSLGGGIMIKGWEQINPTYKVLSVKNPYGMYLVIIKTKHPKSAMFTYEFK